MSIKLPAAIAKYFEIEKAKDHQAASRLFTETAIVRDERKTYVGRDAIRQWMAESSKKYTYTVEPFSIADDGNRIIIISHVVGNFPGSPIDLRYFFILENDRIADLEIVP